MSGPQTELLRSRATRSGCGPGLFESLLWAGGYHLAQLLAALLLLAGLTVVAFDGWPADATVLLSFVQELATTREDWLLTAVMGSATLGSLILILPAALWRMGPAPRRILGTHYPQARQLVLLAGAVLPLGIISDEVYRLASEVQEQLRLILGQRWPWIRILDGGTDGIGLIRQQAASTAYPLLLVMVGVGPAIGEEVIFRGVIGRGLIGRWGPLAGVTVTSLLFAAAHVSPAHAVATLPIAVFLHTAYLATGSIWAPIFVHFLNNTLSVTMMKYGLGQDVQVSMVLIASAAVYVSAMAGLLFVRQRPTLGPIAAMAAGGTCVPTSRPAAECAVAVHGPAWLVVLTGMGVLCFTCSFVLAALPGP